VLVMAREGRRSIGFVVRSLRCRGMVANLRDCSVICRLGLLGQVHPCISLAIPSLIFRDAAFSVHSSKILRLDDRQSGEHLDENTDHSSAGTERKSPHLSAEQVPSPFTQAI